MPKFTEIEKKKIEIDIKYKAKQLFSQYGLKKTSIDQIVQSCNIAKGSFYVFFESKEALYFEILEEEEKFKDQYISEMLNSQLPPKEAFKKFLMDSILYIKNNPFLNNVLNNQEIEILYRKLSPERMNEHFKNDLSSSLGFIKLWASKGIIKNIESTIIVGILRSLFISLQYKDEIGSEIFEEVIETNIDFIINGLFN